MGIVACTRSVVHKKLSWKARIGTFPKEACACRGCLHGNPSIPLIISCVEGVCHCACQQCGYVDHHPIHAHIQIRSHKRWLLRTKYRKSKWPCTLARTLQGSIARPYEGHLLLMLMMMMTTLPPPFHRHRSMVPT